MKFLVMGGTEFVSSSLTKYLISKGYIVDIFTRGIKPLKYDGIRKHLKGDRKSIEDLKVNISNERYDYIFDTSAYEMKDMYFAVLGQCIYLQMRWLQKNLHEVKMQIGEAMD
ncbi:hypothetical protein [Clostridium sp. FP1]|uniref:hypothetical protein n=1 Tax=Clostridium sp. FP1 TaxID=2724076 RepID=UPI001CCA6082|nr:hypothetical protein [Clostridium sp. FP1]MBZ9635143.1 hypothetical protein [Clostridium sp. FP1]